MGIRRIFSSQLLDVDTVFIQKEAQQNLRIHNEISLATEEFRGD